MTLAGRSPIDTATPELLADVEKFVVSAWPVAAAQGIRRLALVSSTPGEGTTTLVSLLGRGLAAHHGLRVLLFDANAHHPDLAPALGITSRGSWRSEPAAAPEACVATAWPGVDCCALDTGRDARDWRETEALHTALGAVASRYDAIVLDCPPLSHAGDALHCVRQADASILVVEAERLPRERLQHSCATLDRLERPFLGAMLNKFERVIPDGLYRRM